MSKENWILEVRIHTMDAEELVIAGQALLLAISRPPWLAKAKEFRRKVRKL